MLPISVMTVEVSVSLLSLVVLAIVEINNVLWVNSETERNCKNRKNVDKECSEHKVWSLRTAACTG